RGVHGIKRDAIEQHAHVAEVRDRYADLADLVASERMIGVDAGLRRKIEGDGQAGLALGEVLPVERVRGGGRGMARIGAEDPRPVAVGLRHELVSSTEHPASTPSTACCNAKCRNLP